MKQLTILLSLLLISVCSFSQSRTISQTTKRIVFARDGGSCRCCGSSASLEYDHIMPFSCGGSSDASNIQLLCMRCNRSKSNSCTCKIHHRTVGINCCDHGTTRLQSSGSSGRSASTQCTAMTKKGNRCKNRTTNPNGRCYLHQ